MAPETKPSWRERAKGWIGLLFAVVCLANVVAAIAWGVYMGLVTTPAREQLATTHAALLGRWQGGALSLELRPDGTVDVHDHFTHYGSKVWRFEDRDFTLWVFPVFRERFHIDALPRTDASGHESLVVNGYHLERPRL